MDTRTITLQGCFNFRDLGGYPTDDGRSVRWRSVFRSDSVHHATEDDARFLFDTLAVRTLIDLRNAAEADALGLGLIAEITRHHLPVLELGADPQALAQLRSGLLA